ncbi:MAG: thioredoxin family protein [Planctomycetaceae bacterium]|nr:thioredoxin family protein [Planctomycetaceae bacterium]
MRCQFWTVSCALLFLLLLNSGVVTAGKYNRVVEIGDKVPGWQNLPGVDGKTHSWEDHKQAKAIAVVFTSNDCPVASAYQSRLNSLATDFKDQGLALVAINVNRGENLAAMKSRAQKERFAFDYLHDVSQQTARNLGAVCTPQAFLFAPDGQIVYMGAIDDNWQNANGVKQDFLRQAIKSVLAGMPPKVQESRQIGCAIKWNGR